MSQLLDRIKPTWVFLGLGALGLWLWHSGALESPAPDAGGDEDITPFDAGDPSMLDPDLVPGPCAVVHRERADGVDARLQSFLDWWELSGPFQICVCPKGGVRTDEEEQLAFFSAGTSGAQTLAETPHGRGGALDLAPYFRFAPHWDGQEAAFRIIGQYAKAHGLTWGGDWRRRDMPHVEVPGWQSLPFPPGGVS